jgi:hypothetical protein
MGTCYLCGSKPVDLLLDFGLQPICNRFPADAAETEATFPMRLEQCRMCGLVQTTQPVPAEEVKPQVDWITYSEPEGHLDLLADKLMALPHLSPTASFAGISFKDDTLLRRMEQRGFSAAWRLDPQRDLGIADAGTGVETLQHALSPAAARKVAAERGQVDVFLVRHVFEHTHRPRQFVEAVCKLVKPGGYLMLEIPDCERALDSCDYSMLWEEHTLYFTPRTFCQSFSQCGLTLAWFECFPYTLENCLVGVARIGQGESLPAEVAVELKRGRRFAEQLETQRLKYQSLPGKIAMFGAGHLAATFINLLELKRRFEFVVDDNPHKRGRLMPGSKLPIVGSRTLVDRQISLCLMSVAVESEEKVIANNQEFLLAGGKFASIFPASNYALRL